METLMQIVAVFFSGFILYLFAYLYTFMFEAVIGLIGTILFGIIDLIITAVHRVFGWSKEVKENEHE